MSATEADVSARPYSVTIDHNMSLCRMILDGWYDYEHTNISSEPYFRDFVGGGIVTEEVVLVHLGRDSSNDDVTAELRKRGLWDAMISELLAFGAAFPGLQNDFPIITRSRSPHRCASPVLTRFDLPRGQNPQIVRLRALDLVRLEGHWNGDVRFLAVRMGSAPA